jgi:hypothetical protein
VTGTGTSAAETLRVAERVGEILHRQQIEAVVIGAMALAVHGYPRLTKDFDLAIGVLPGELQRIAEALREEGWSVEVHTPDANDPLGGVIDVRAPGAALVQIVNFDNSPAGGFPRLAREACLSAVPLAPDSALKVVSLFSLVAFKLYAGGHKSAHDILELLDRNPSTDLDALRAFCQSLRLGQQLERVLDLAKQP